MRSILPFSKSTTGDERLWNATLALNSAIIEKFAEAPPDADGCVQALLALGIGLPGYVIRALDAPTAALRTSRSQRARSVLAKIATRLHIAADSGLVSADELMDMRVKGRTIADLLDLGALRETRAEARRERKSA